MASSYTENLGLCQWSASDAVLRRDFNSDNQKLDLAYKQMPRIVAGHYIGDGTYGEANPKRLSLTFTPLLVVIVPDTGYSSCPGTVLVYGQSASNGMARFDSSSSAMQLKVTWDDTSVSWYSENDSARLQLNEEGQTYYFFAVGSAP